MSTRWVPVVGLLVSGWAFAQEVYSPPPPPPQVAPEQPARYPQQPPPGYPPQYYAPRPERLDYDGTEVPGYHLVSRPRWGLLGPGIGVLGVSYGLVALGVLSSLAASSSQAVLLLIPVAGPFTLLSQTGGSATALLVLDGVAQVAGLAMIVLGIALPNRWLELDAQFRLALGAPRAPLGLSLSVAL